MRITFNFATISYSFLIAFFSSAITVYPANSASFDCTKAQTLVEEAICEHGYLSDLDEQLSDAYKVALQIENPSIIKSEQQKWLEVRNNCRTNECITNKYIARLKELEPFDYSYLNNNYETPKCSDPINEIAFRFGETIKKIFVNEDLLTLITHIEGELENGFRKRYAINANFGEVFPQNTVNAVVASTVECDPVGWRGYMLGNGEVWYDCNENGCNIRSILSNPEPLKYKQNGFEISGTTISPKCFSYEWMSGDNFEEYADKFKIIDYDDFRVNTGLYFGREITDFQSIVPNWCVGNCSEINLINSVGKCNAEPSFINNNAVILNDLSYVVLDQKIANCSQLSPNLAVNLKDCFLVSMVEQTGGSMGGYSRHGIYGIAALPQLGESIIPLKFFDTINDALNYLDTAG